MKRKKEKKQKTDKEAKLKKLKYDSSAAACFNEKKVQRRRERKAEERVCSRNNFSLYVETNTSNSRAAVSAEKTKKNHRYLAIKLTHVDTLYSLKNSYT